MKGSLQVNELISRRGVPVANGPQCRVFIGNSQNTLIDTFSVLLYVHQRAIWHHYDMLRTRYEIRQIDRDERVVGAAFVFHLRRKLADDFSELRSGGLREFCRKRETRGVFLR